MKFKKRALIFITIMGMFLLASVCNAMEQISPEWIQVENLHFEKDAYGDSYVVGSIRNISNRELVNIFIEGNFYDSSGVQIGNGNLMVQNLVSGGVAKISFNPCAPAGTANFKIMNIDVFAK